MGLRGTPLLGPGVHLVPGHPMQTGGQPSPGVPLARPSGGLAVVGEGSQDAAANHSNQPKAVRMALPGHPVGTPTQDSLGVHCQSGGRVAGKDVPLARGGLQKDIPQLWGVPECHKDKCWKANTQPSKRQQ